MASPELLYAIRLLIAGAWHEAEAAARAAIDADPDTIHAQRLLGLAIAAMGDGARAAPILVRAAAEAPNGKHPCADLASLRPPLPRPLVARQFQACLRLSPGNWRLSLDFAEFLLDTDQPELAEAILKDLPPSAATHHLTGLALAERNRFPEAIAGFRQAVALNPNAAASWSNLGMMLKVEGDYAAAISAHDQAVAAGRGEPRFRVNRAVTLLKAGIWDRAWQDYEARLDLTGAPAVYPQRLLPSIKPREDLGGLTILARHEDGFGDTLQFLRYLPLLAKRGARVIACVPPSLVRIMRMVPGVSEVVTDPKRLPAHDFVCPMFSLPRVFATTVDTIPPVTAISLDPALVRRWAGILPAAGLRAGLVWAGQARPALPGFGTLDRRRSAGLTAFRPVLDVPGVAFVSLQAGPAARQAHQAGLNLTDPMPDVSDFADTAAIIAGLDVVISVDTSVVHLAGLTGKSVLLLDRYDGCWRWLSGRSDSPWYPHLTLYRQSRPGDWTEPMVSAAADLAGMVTGPRQPGISVKPRRHAFVA
jgi:tetratricopeptide (TPR) repeat protein